jgi:hypothetical protein
VRLHFARYFRPFSIRNLSHDQNIHLSAQQIADCGLFNWGCYEIEKTKPIACQDFLTHRIYILIHGKFGGELASARDPAGEILRSGKTLMANGKSFSQGLYDNGLFLSTLETARETPQRKK